MVLVGYGDDVAMVAVAASIEELEWMKENGLKLAQEKSEAVLDGHKIRFQDIIRYLGIWIDKHWNFKDHIRRTSTKAGNVGTAL